MGNNPTAVAASQKDCSLHYVTKLRMLTSDIPETFVVKILVFSG